MADTTPAFPEILPVIEDYLKTAKAAGKPMRVHLWDNHYVNESPQVVADKSLYDLIKKYGSPLYVFEDAMSSSTLDQLTKSYVTGNEREQEEAKQILDSFITIKGKAIRDIIYYAKQDPETRVIFPDVRGQDLKDTISKLTPQEIAVLEKINPTEIMINIPNGSVEKLADEDRKILNGVRSKIRQVLVGNENSLDTTLMDERIAANINKVYRTDKDVQITFYGGAHFAKKHDLDEIMPGLTIAISDKSKLEPIQAAYLDKKNSKIHNQFPDYVYYPKEKRLVKLDNDSAKAEFIGITENQFKAWELSTQLPTQIKLPVIDSPISGATPALFSASQTVSSQHRSA